MKKLVTVRKIDAVKTIDDYAQMRETDYATRLGVKLAV